MTQDGPRPEAGAGPEFDAPAGYGELSNYRPTPPRDPSAAAIRDGYATPERPTPYATPERPTPPASTWPPPQPGLAAPPAADAQAAYYRPEALGPNTPPPTGHEYRPIDANETVRRLRGERHRPVVTWSIIAICVVVWGAEFLVPGFFEAVALIPSYGATEPWRFLTSAFAHSSTIFHIGFNMYALWIVGGSIEPLLGRLRFAIIYLLSALAGGVAFVALSFPGPGGEWNTMVVGASGAVFGLFAALLVVYRFLKIRPWSMLVIIGLNVVIAFVVPNIAWQAHLGGFVYGGVATAIAMRGMRRQAQGKPDQLTWPALGGLFVLLLLITVVKYVTVAG